MKRALFLLFLLCAIIRSVPAQAFTLLDPNTWPTLQPRNWASSFNLQNWPPALNPHNWPFDLFPVPEVSTNPNGGVVYGILLAFLFKDNKNQISSILAPDLNNDTALGPGGTVRYFAYPSEDTEWYALAGAQERIAQTVDLNYEAGRLHEKWYSFEARLFYERDPTDRFFGFGNGSRLGGESNYTTEQVYVRGQFGWNITHSFQLAVVARPRYVRIFDGAFTTIPQTPTFYPNVKGIGGGSEIYGEVRATYDSRDSVDIPRSGTLLIVFEGTAQRALLSSFSYNRFGIDLHHYWTLSPRLTFAAHGYIQYMPSGNEAPFWARGRLGGEASILYDQETLRGYGTGRFNDNNLSVANFELRTRVFEASIMNTHGILELAPFVDAGQVFHDMSGDPVGSLHPVVGMGFRAIAEPFVVGYVDVGEGGEGAAVFAGINYPF
ncbi:MAG: BamA/TamA family outer membrane protein [Deltaproteobacteria bacterium]|nr:BamA/TamA family outer membrane protein [Deltaproteobacteria bacterium]